MVVQRVHTHLSRLDKATFGPAVHTQIHRVVWTGGQDVGTGVAGHFFVQLDTVDSGIVGRLPFLGRGRLHGEPSVALEDQLAPRQLDAAPLIGLDVAHPLAFPFWTNLERDDGVHGPDDRVGSRALRAPAGRPTSARKW